MPETPKDKRQPDDAEQSKRFRDTAKDVGADENESAADEAFKGFVKNNPPAKKR
jgi:hypothetical protein